jgi:hypothetical protein
MNVITHLLSIRERQGIRLIIGGQALKFSDLLALFLFSCYDIGMTCVFPLGWMSRLDTSDDKASLYS